MKRVKRILHCIPTMGGGGAERQLGYLCRGLADRGWDVHVGLLREGPNMAQLRLSGAKIHLIPSLGNHDLATIWRIHRIIRGIRPSLVQTWIPMMDTIGGAACRLTGTTHVISERSSSPGYPGTLKNWLRLLVANGARAVVSNSSGGDEYWRGRNDGRFRRYIIPNALPLQEIDQEVPVQPAELGASQGQKIVLHVGRFHQEKNLENLVLALKFVMRRPAVVAVLCGDGPLVPETEELIRREGLSDRVFLPGYVMNIWRWMKSADVFVSASLFEGMPNTVMEAMACGCPIVASDIPSHRDILGEDSATFIAPGDPRSIAAGIDGILENREEATRQALCAKERAARWSIPEMARRYEEVYFHVLESEGLRGPGQEK